MISLKLDLKILDKLILIFLIITTSCRSITLDSHSMEIESFIKTEYPESELPSVMDIEPIDVTFSNKYLQPQKVSILGNSNMPILSYSLMSILSQSIPIIDISGKEYSLPIPDIKVEVIKSDTIRKTVVKPKVKIVVKPELKSVKKNVSIAVTKPVIKKLEVKNVKKPVDKKIEVLFLKDMEVQTAMSFTIEMDQTGWLFENHLENLQFKNKFYTSSKVLFEFIPDKPGQYNIEFVKYTDEGKIYSRVNVEAVTKVLSRIDNEKSLVIIPEKIKKGISEKRRLEKTLANINNINNGDEIYFKLAKIYYDEGLLKKSKEYYEYVYDNYPLSIYYEEAKNKMKYIIDNFLKVR